MKINTKHFTDSASKDEEELALYQNHDYLTAYSKHTDLRIERDGYKLAIGAQSGEGWSATGWDEHGEMQLNFLKSCGLKPEHMLLDYGCGTGRLARKASEYLEEGHYTGIDISRGCIDNCLKLSQEEGWADRLPLFLLGTGTFDHPGVKDHYDYIWSHSIFTHTPPEICEKLIESVSKIKFYRFYFTYKEAKDLNRSGLKQFQYPPEYFVKLCKKHGIKAQKIMLEFPGGQRIIACQY